MARLRLDAESLSVQSFTAVTEPVRTSDDSQFPDCDSFSGGPPCCSEGCPDSHTCPDQASCNHNCTWPECP